MNVIQYRPTLGPLLALLASPAALAQCPEQSFQGLDTQIGDEFGVALDTFAPRMIVGAARDADLGAAAGTAFVFLLGPNGFAQETKLHGSQVNSGDLFGRSVAMTGVGALVGAPGGDGFSAGSGTVYAFLRVGTNWTETGELDPGEGSMGDRFGWSVAIDGTRAVVGAPSAAAHATAPDAGAAYVFEYGGGNGWQLVTKLVPSGIFGDPGYGHSVALDGDRVVVGAPGDDDGGHNAGAAYVFDQVGGNWFLTVKLIPTDFEPDAAFGWAVGVDGDDVIVGAPIATTTNARSGAAYLFNDSGGPWTQDAKLFDATGTNADRFGYSVSLQGDHAMAGAPFREAGGQVVGGVYECEREAGAWSVQHALESPSTTPDAHLFGTSVLVDGTLRAVGDSAATECRVHAFVLDDDPDCNGNGVPDPCDIANGTSTDNNGNDIPDECDGCVMDNYCTSGPNSTGAAAVISATGSLSISANDLVLHASPVPNQPGLFFFGPGDAFLPFGNGVRCVAGPLLRLPVTVASGNVMTTALDHDVPPTLGQIHGFETRYFQCWYRDPAAGGASFDLTDGLKVTFCP